MGYLFLLVGQSSDQDSRSSLMLSGYCTPYFNVSASLVTHVPRSWVYICVSDLASSGISINPGDLSGRRTLYYRQRRVLCQVIELLSLSLSFIRHPSSTFIIQDSARLADEIYPHGCIFIYGEIGSMCMCVRE